MMKFQLFFGKQTENSFALYNGDTPTLQMIGDDMDLIFYTEAGDVSFKCPVIYKYDKHPDLGIWSTGKGFTLLGRMQNGKRTKVKSIEIPVLHFLSYRLLELAKKEWITIEDFLMASIDVVMVIPEELYEKTRYYFDYQYMIDRNDALDYMGYPPKEDPENFNGIVPIHFLDGDTDKIAFVDTLRGQEAEGILWWN